jgi:hypothetical protein
MKTIIPLLLFIILVISYSIPAQNWSTEELEIIDQVKKNWDAWGAAIQQKDLEVWKKVCQPMKDFTGWWVSEGSLWTQEATERFFSKWVKGLNNFYWENLQPQSIKIYDNFAVTFFYVIYDIETVEGKKIRSEDKRLEVFRKVNGVWRFAHAMVSTSELVEAL